jgi:thiosulfate/3-mercaptopyruvate sulfurtransferase
MHLPFIVEPAELFAHIEDASLLIVDLCSAEKYSEGHIAGAIHLNTADLMGGVKPVIGTLPSAEQLAYLFARLGLTPDMRVVCYDDEGGPWAGRLIWTLDMIGHQKYSFLNGGKTAWLAEGLPLESGNNLPASIGLNPLHMDNKFSADIADIVAQKDTANFLVWDARSLDEYTGQKALSARGGHIPGAVHCEWTELLDPHCALRLRKDLAEYLAAKGITPEKNIVTHCQTHRRSGLTYVAAKSLGYPNIRAYPGSWSEWGNCDDVPVATGNRPLGDL